MKAIAIVPGRPETAGLIDLPEPPTSDGSVLVRTRSIGICGTDAERLAQLITRRVTPEEWPLALMKRPEDIKVAIDMTSTF